MEPSVSPLELLTEFVEVSIHQILFHRKIYPREHFRPARHFNCKTMLCQHPKVRNYLDEFIQSLYRLVLDRVVNKVVVAIISQETRKVLERYVFDFRIPGRSGEFLSLTSREEYHKISQMFSYAIRKVQLIETMSIEDSNYDGELSFRLLVSGECDMKTQDCIESKGYWKQQVEVETFDAGNTLPYQTQGEINPSPPSQLIYTIENPGILPHARVSMSVRRDRSSSTSTPMGLYIFSHVELASHSR